MNGKTFFNGSKGVRRHYYYQSYPKLDPGISEIRSIPCSCYDCTRILYLSWYKKNHLISLDMEDYKIASTLNLLVAIITGL